MSWLVSRLPRWIPVPGKRLMGRDLEGNKYFEAPNAAGARPKRSVEYRILADISEYTSSGRSKLPIQWRAWLAHTRPEPPSLPELQADRSRLDRLTPMVAAIEARERAERIRQGYLPAPSAPAPASVSGSAAGSLPLPLSAPGRWGMGINSSGSGSSGANEGPQQWLGGPEDRQSGLPSSARQVLSGPSLPSLPSSGPTQHASDLTRSTPYPPAPARKYPSAPSDEPTSLHSRPSPSSSSSNSAGLGSQQPSTSTSTSSRHPSGPSISTPSPPASTFNPLSASSSIAGPAKTVDPMKYDDPAQLRRLAEADTKRRIAASRTRVGGEGTGEGALRGVVNTSQGGWERTDSGHGGSGRVRGAGAREGEAEGGEALKPRRRGGAA